MRRVPPPRVKPNLKNALLGFLPEQETLLIACTHLSEPSSGDTIHSQTERRRAMGKGSEAALSNLSYFHGPGSVLSRTVPVCLCAA